MSGPRGMEPSKPHHLAQERNRFGTHDRVAFTPSRNYLLRCPNCNRLMAPDFALETRCPNCRKAFTKKEWADMMVEAAHVDAAFGGWTHEALEYLGRLKVSGQIGRNLTPEPLSDVSRNVVAANLAIRDQMMREEHARKRLTGALRNISPVSRALRGRSGP